MDRWTLCWKWIAAIAVITALAILYFFPFDRSWFYPQCLFYQLTGLECPGCGSLRSMRCLLHGKFVRAFEYNPLLYFLAPALLICRRHLHKPAWAWSLVAVVVVFTIGRNL